ncbi:MAG: M1 family metallopeptidase [Flavobacteriales bacterium]|nr:M1 family metallopeptidase [Flavobacteriales bacterium]MCB9166505.1 M1 family metallopeptidase [Flavobacteriales bacterium]
MPPKYAPVLLAGLTLASAVAQDNGPGHGRFQQMIAEWPTPNEYRTASGAPGHAYWQQKVDYDMHVTIDDATQKLTGEETITYRNNSPDGLDYLWLQLDQDLWVPGSDAEMTTPGRIGDSIPIARLRNYSFIYVGGFRITAVRDGGGRDLDHTVNGTMMRVDLPHTLAPGRSFVFHIDWWYPINDRLKVGGRSGWEYFPEDGNYIYAMAQFYPRLCAYNDYEGWQNKQFLGRGEFTLEFGDFKVAITVPADHIVGATGELQNASSVLTPEQRSRLERARSASRPLMIVTEDEAHISEKKKATDTRTWVFKAGQVRDFAFASSRKFLWDGMDQTVGDHHVLCMSFYPGEADPLWGQYSTRAVAHAIKTYSKYSIDYPYPVAQSIHTDRMGMEYPMICFNGVRPEKDGTYSEEAKLGLIKVVIHEVGHNFFPMVINSDERQWAWQDEGFNTFLETLTYQEWDRDMPIYRGTPLTASAYMKGDRSKRVPIMTGSDEIPELHDSQYNKTAAGLNILRETIMGRALFDKAFHTYCQRWLFKHPTPWDFFRTMEDASAMDLDWFWRGWFYTTEPVDLSIDHVRCVKADPNNRSEPRKIPPTLTHERNLKDVPQTVVERDPGSRDFYDNAKDAAALPIDGMAGWSAEERAALADAPYLYEVTFSNKGGMPMPLIVQWTYADGTTEVDRIPALVWRMEDTFTRVFAKLKEVTDIQLDPDLETADIDTGNNVWHGPLKPEAIKVFKERSIEQSNPMREAKKRGRAGN